MSIRHATRGVRRNGLPLTPGWPSDWALSAGEARGVGRQLRGRAAGTSRVQLDGFRPVVVAFGTMGKWAVSRVHATVIRRAASRSLAFATAVASAALLTPTSAAFANYFGTNTLYNANNCGGTCNLKGVRSDILAPDHFTLADGSAGVMRVSAESFNGGLLQGGIIKTQSWTGGDCSDNNTGGIHSYYEHIVDNNPGSADCQILGASANEQHNFKVQRIDTSSTRWQISVDGSAKNDFGIGFSTADYILAGGELAGPHRGDGTELIKGTYPAGSSDAWQRTTNVHHPGSSDTTWTTIQTSQCFNGIQGQNGTGAHYHIGDPPSQFLVYWDFPNPTTCPR